MLLLPARSPSCSAPAVHVSSSFSASSQLKTTTANCLAPTRGAICQCRCGRRRLLGGASAGAVLPFITTHAMAAPPADPAEQMERMQPTRPDWYQKLYARLMDRVMRSYEAQIAGQKEKLFSNLTGPSKNILELGVGTGPNFKYYASADGLNIIGVDPNKYMEEYARAAAAAAGLPSTNFTFKRGVVEALPVEDNTMDAVIGTLVLCSVRDVDLALREVKRVLKPGGLYLFIEHVAAPDGSFRKFVQRVADPLQQLVADGCHLCRNTGQQIEAVGFSNVSMDMALLVSNYIVAPHVCGVAYK